MKLFFAVEGEPLPSSAAPHGASVTVTERRPVTAPPAVPASGDAEPPATAGRLRRTGGAAGRPSTANPSADSPTTDPMPRDHDPSSA